MELPREIQLYIYKFLYDKWRPLWNKVMKELVTIEIKVRIFKISGLLSKSWHLDKVKEIKICIVCGNYYKIPMYSCHKLSCDCQ